MGGATGAAMSVLDQSAIEATARRNMVISIQRARLDGNSNVGNVGNLGGSNQEIMKRAIQGVDQICNNLPVVTYRSTRDTGSGSDANQSTCTICLESFVTGDEMLTLPCFHRFHVNCCKKWWLSKVSSTLEDPYSRPDRMKPTCPSCKCDVLEYVKMAERND
jgi:hypothetical protein